MANGNNMWGAGSSNPFQSGWSQGPNNWSQGSGWGTTPSNTGTQWGGWDQYGGTGNQYFSTDTAAALRANEIHADIILKATKVDGIYDSDPEKNPKAKRFRKITYMNALRKQLRVMDATAFSLCMENLMPIVVFDLFKPHNIRNVVMGKSIGTLVHE